MYQCSRFIGYIDTFLIWHTSPLFIGISMVKRLSGKGLVIFLRNSRTPQDVPPANIRAFALKTYDATEEIEEHILNDFIIDVKQRAVVCPRPLYVSIYVLVIQMDFRSVQSLWISVIVQDVLLARTVGHLCFLIVHRYRNAFCFILYCVLLLDVHRKILVLIVEASAIHIGYFGSVSVTVFYPLAVQYCRNVGIVDVGFNLICDAERRVKAQVKAGCIVETKTQHLLNIEDVVNIVAVQSRIVKANPYFAHTVRKLVACLVAACNVIFESAERNITLSVVQPYCKSIVEIPCLCTYNPKLANVITLAIFKVAQLLIKIWTSHLVTSRQSVNLNFSLAYPLHSLMVLHSRYFQSGGKELSPNRLSLRH